MLLAGGEAKRYGGEPKGLVTLAGERIADRVLRALAEATGKQVVVANDPRAPEWFRGLSVITDDQPGLGPLAGIQAGLAAAAGASVIVAAWDMPFVTGRLLRAIRAFGGGDVHAVVPSHGPLARIEPLCAWYAADALPACTALLAAGERRARALPAMLRGTRLLTEAELEPFGDADALFTSVDSPDDLALATRLLDLARHP